MTPPFTLNNHIIHLIAHISELLGKLSVLQPLTNDLNLRKVNQIRTIHGTLAIEGNELTEQQITTILAGKRVIAPVKEVQEAKNALEVYARLFKWHPEEESGLLQAHRCLMLGLLDSAGVYRSGDVGVMKQQQVVHRAPPANRVHILMQKLFDWLSKSEDHPLINTDSIKYLIAQRSHS